MINIVKPLIMALAFGFLVGCGSGGGSSSPLDDNNISDNNNTNNTGYKALSSADVYDYFPNFTKDVSTENVSMRMAFTKDEAIAYMDTLVNIKGYSGGFELASKLYPLPNYEQVYNANAYGHHLSDYSYIDVSFNLNESNGTIQVNKTLYDDVFLPSTTGDAISIERHKSFDGQDLTDAFEAYGDDLVGNHSFVKSSNGIWEKNNTAEGVYYKFYYNLDGRDAYWLVGTSEPYTGNNTNNTKDIGGKALPSANVFYYFPPIPYFMGPNFGGSGELRMAFTKTKSIIYMDTLATDRNFTGGSEILVKTYPFPDYEQVWNANAFRRDSSDYSYVTLYLSFKEQDGDIYVDNSLYASAFIPLTGDIIYIERQKYYTDGDYTDSFEAYAANDLVADRGFTKVQYIRAWEKHDTERGRYYNFSYLSDGRTAIWKVEKRPYVFEDSFL